MASGSRARRKVHRPRNINQLPLQQAKVTTYEIGLRTSNVASSSGGNIIQLPVNINGLRGIRSSLQFPYLALFL